MEQQIQAQENARAAQALRPKAMPGPKRAQMTAWRRNQQRAAAKEKDAGDQEPQWADVNNSGVQGVFGTSNTSTNMTGFNFVAPLPPSIGAQLSFGAPAVSDDARGGADAIQEELARRNRPFTIQGSAEPPMRFASPAPEVTNSPFTFNIQPANAFTQAANSQIPQPTASSFTFNSGSINPFSQASSSQVSQPPTPSFSFNSGPANLFTQQSNNQTSQPPSSGFTFNSGPVNSFGQTLNSQVSQPPTSGFSFSSGPANSFGQAVSQPATPSFSFGQASSNQSSQAPTSGFSFSSGPTNLFGQAPITQASQPPTSGFSFAQSSSNQFSQAPAPIFSFDQTSSNQSSQAPAPIFSFDQTPNNQFSQAPTPGFSFTSEPANQFGQAVSQPSTPSFSFGQASSNQSSQAPTPSFSFNSGSNNMFNQPLNETPQLPTAGVSLPSGSSNPFAQINRQNSEPPTSGLSFSNGSNNLFGQQSRQSSEPPTSAFSFSKGSSNLFAQQPRQTSEPPAPVSSGSDIPFAKVSSQISEPPVSTGSSNIFAQTLSQTSEPPPASSRPINLFAQPSNPIPQAPSAGITFNNEPAKSLTQASSASTATALFSPTSLSTPPVAASPTAGTFSFALAAPEPPPPSAVNTTSSDLVPARAFALSDLPAGTVSISKSMQEKLGSKLDRILQAAIDDNWCAENLEALCLLGDIDLPALYALMPAHYDDMQRLRFEAGFRLQSLSNHTIAAIKLAGKDADVEPIYRMYRLKRAGIIAGARKAGVSRSTISDPIIKKARAEPPWKNGKRNADAQADKDEIDTGPRKVAKSASSTSPFATPSSSSLFSKSDASSSNTGLNGSRTPQAQGESNEWRQTAQSQPPAAQFTSPSKPNGSDQSMATSAASGPKSKRKAEYQLTDKDDMDSPKQSRGNLEESETSGIFKKLVDNSPSTRSPHEGGPDSTIDPVKKLSAEELAGSGRKLAAPKRRSMLNQLASGPSNPVSKANPKPNPFAAASASNSTPAKSNPFASVASAKDTPAGSNPFANIASAKDTPAKANPFANVAPSASSIFTAKSTPSATNASSAASVFAPTGSTFVLKTNESTTSSSGGFTPLKAPRFGVASVNFLEQFGNQAKKDKEAAEKKAMEDAKAEDMDSDDDEAEWEAKYKEKKLAEKKEYDEAAKNAKSFSFKPAASLSGSEKSSSQPLFISKVTPTSDSVFAQPKPLSSATSSLFATISRSATSSPAAGSATGSIFDSHASHTPTSFGGNNIFGHLSDVGSGSDKGNAADNDSDDEESAGFDDDKNDPSYEPDKEGSVIGTPVEATGDGIASAKKSVPNIFGSGASTPTPSYPTSTFFNFGGTPTPSTLPATSGGLFGRVSPAPTSTPPGGLFGRVSPAPTSTPPGGLFERISKDSKGNPLRQAATEEEVKPAQTAGFSFGSTTPAGKPAASTTSNIFGSLTSGSTPSTLFKFGSTTPAAASTTPFAPKSTSPADQTWKTDSPIKFGAAAPTVNVTGATPEKPSPFAGLFGNTVKPATPGLFAGLNKPKEGEASMTPTPSPFAGFGGDKPALQGFNFGGVPSAASSLFPSAAGSTTTSRATTDNEASDNEKALEEEFKPQEQVDFTSAGAGTENEDELFQIKTKLMKFVTKEGEPVSKGAFESKGVGMLFVLKNKTTGKSRVLLRFIPRGNIGLNKSILPTTYAARGKTVTVQVAADSGGSLETFLFQVKTEDSAKELAATLERAK